MVFSSTIFLFAFLPFTLAGYYLLPQKARNEFLLCMSLLFYAVGEPSFVFVMLLSIAINYLMGIAISAVRSAGQFLRRLVLVLAVAVNLALLFYYKYFDFAVGLVNGLLHTELPLKRIALPIGISFFTFQSMSYLFDLHMGKTAVQKNPFRLALYVALFPQLIAGPIVRYADVAREISFRKSTTDDFAYGLNRFAVGLMKKVVLSNNIALLADQAFAMQEGHFGLGVAWLGAIAYAFQIYFDFSGYSDMAIGLGRMFGFHFLENFHYPYLSCSISNFWRRWHISLSSWFRDYVYIPMGGNRRGNVYMHLLVVFLLTGLWHGASWNFIVWGIWHGMFILIERLAKHRTWHLPKPIGWLYTMLVVLVGWVWFRAPSLSAAMAYLKTMAGFRGLALQESFYLLEDYGMLLLVCVASALPIVPWMKRHLREETQAWLRPVLVCTGMLVGIAFTVTSTYNPFIYFNF